MTQFDSCKPDNLCNVVPFSVSSHVSINLLHAQFKNAK